MPLLVTRASALATPLVGVDDVLHQAVPDDVAALQFHDPDPLNAAKLVRGVDEAERVFAGRSICVVSPVTIIFES